MPYFCVYVTQHGKTALHEALSSTGNVLIVTSLLLHGADPNTAPKVSPPSDFFVYDTFHMSRLEVIVQVRGRDGMSTPQNGVAAYSQSHVFARVVSHCLLCTFHLPECPSSMVGPLTSLSFSQQPASDEDSACPASKTPLGYLYLVAAPW